MVNSLPEEEARFFHPGCYGFSSIGPKWFAQQLLIAINMSQTLRKTVRHISSRMLRIDLVLRDNSGRIWGVAFLAKSHHSCLSYEYELGLAVHPLMRGRGFGLKLSRDLLCRARRDGERRVWLTVVKENHEAIRLYEKMGFVATRAVKDTWKFGEEDSLEMALDL